MMHLHLKVKAVRIVTPLVGHALFCGSGYIYLLPQHDTHRRTFLGIYTQEEGSPMSVMGRTKQGLALELAGIYTC